MRLKYFLRGAGTGVVVTAILFMILLTALDWGPRSESRQVENAAEDGTNQLVGEDGQDYLEAEKQKAEEEGEDSETTGTSEASDAAETSGTTDAAEKAETTDAAEAAQASENVTEDSAASDTSAATAEGSSSDSTSDKKPSVTKTVTFSIRDGEGSDGIAANLETLGLVDDASKFNDYLSANGYDRKLRTGTFKIATGLSYADLAKLLCSKPE